MKRNSYLTIAWNLTGILLLLAAAAAFAGPPETINIRGQLLDADGHGLPGLRDYSVQFHDAESGGNALGVAINGTAEVSLEGLFNIPVAIPPAALAAAELWYELAISSSATPGPLTAADAFPNRVKVESVPFALEAAEVSHVDLSAVGSGVVTDTEFEALSGVASAIQDQIDAKANGADVYTKTEMDTAQGLQDDEITLRAYAADVYTKSEVDTLQGLQDDEIAAKLPRVGESFIVVDVAGDAAGNGANLLAAYDAAKALTPCGSPLSATNRAVVLVPPGQYGLGTGALVMDTDFVDLVGLSTARENQHIYGASNGADTGVLMQTASDVRIENLLIHCTLSSGSLSYNSTDPAAYWTNATWNDGADRTGSPPSTTIRNCEFRSNQAYAASMRFGVVYGGVYEDCAAGRGGFGYRADASGSFVRCVSGDYSFAVSATANGTFTNCTAADSSFGAAGTASGKFTNCIGGNYAFGGGSNGTASGTFTNCAAGDYAFGFSGTASGAFTDCTGGNYTFAGYGTASGSFTNCIGGDYAFGGYLGTASGTFTDCKGGDSAFGGAVGTASGVFTNCTGGDWAFGGNGGTASGTFIDCIGGNYGPFGGKGGNTTGGLFRGCILPFDWDNGTASTFNGRMENCRWGDTDGNWALGADARVYNSTFLGNVNLNNSTAGIAGCFVKGTIQNAGSASFNQNNLENTDVN